MPTEHEQTFRNPNIRTVISPVRSGGAEVSTPIEPSPSQPEKQSHRTRNVLIGSAAGVALAAGAVFGISSVAATPESSPVATASADPAETTPATTAPEVQAPLTVEALEIPSDLTPEQVGMLLVNDRMSQWDMAGATPETQDEWLAGVGGVIVDVREYAQERAAENADLFTSAMFIDGWEEDPQLVDFVETQQQQNAAFLGGWLSTYDSPHPDDLEPFEVSNMAESAEIVAQADASTTYEIVGTMHANADRNRIGSQNPDALGWDNDSYLTTVTLVPAVDGTQRISAIHFGPIKN